MIVNPIILLYSPLNILLRYIIWCLFVDDILLCFHENKIPCDSIINILDCCELLTNQKLNIY